MKSRGDNFRLLHPSSHVWRIVDDSAAKTPAVGGVPLDNQEFPPSRLDTSWNPNPWKYALPAIRKWDELEPEPRPWSEPLNYPDFAHGDGKGQPAWLRPYKCFRPFAHLYAGKRTLSGGELPETHTWHISLDRWSTAQIECAICGGPLPEWRRKFCSDECAHNGDNLRRRRKRSRIVTQNYARNVRLGT